MTMQLLFNGNIYILKESSSLKLVRVSYFYSILRIKLIHKTLFNKFIYNFQKEALKINKFVISEMSMAPLFSNSNIAFI